MTTAVGDLRATLAAPVAVVAWAAAATAAPPGRTPSSSHHLTRPGALRDAAALLSAYAAVGPAEDAAYEVPALLTGREPFVDWARSDVVARSALLGAAISAADAFARRAGAAASAGGAAPATSASLSAAAADMAACILGWVDALVAEAGAAASAAARVSPLGFAAPSPLTLGPLTLTPGDGPDATAAALRGLQIGDATLACHALDWAAARVGLACVCGGTSSSPGPAALAAALAAPPLARPLDPATPAHRAVRARAAAAVHALVAAARAELGRVTGGGGGSNAPLPPSILKVAHLVAASVVPALEAGLGGEYPLRRSAGWGGGGGGCGEQGAGSGLPGAALAASARPPPPRPRREGGEAGEGFAPAAPPRPARPPRPATAWPPPGPPSWRRLTPS